MKQLTRRLFILLAFVAVYFSSAEAFAAPRPLGLDIAAVVGDEAISTYDVDSRVRFVIATTNLPNTKEVRSGIRAQVLRTLINEHLQTHHALEEGFTIKDKDVKRAIKNIEKQRGMAEGSIFKMLKRKNVPTESFAGQIRAQLLWGKLVVNLIRPGIKISEAEVRKARIRLPSKKINQELRIAVLMLPVDKAAREAPVKKLAQKLSREIRKGASYEEIYRQFSGLPSGAHPDTFWVKPRQLDSNVSQALVNAQPGLVTPPIRSREGYLIVKVYDARSKEKPGKGVEVMLKEIVLRLKPDASVDEANLLLNIGQEVAKNPGTCEEKGIASIDNIEDVDIEVSHRRGLLSELPQAVKIIAENLHVGDISTPFASSQGIRLYMLCEKKTAKKKEVQMEQLADLLFQRKLELEAQKYLRNLRRESFIEIRG